VAISRNLAKAPPPRRDTWLSGETVHRPKVLGHAKASMALGGRKTLGKCKRLHGAIWLPTRPRHCRGAALEPLLLFASLATWLNSPTMNRVVTVTAALSSFDHPE